MIASASPDLTEAGKRYIAENFGIGGCFVYSELTWTRVDKDGETTVETGGTVKLINRLTEPMIVDYIIINSSNYTYAELKAANGNNDIDLDDITWMAEHDGYPPGEDQYCIAVTTTPTPTPIQSTPSSTPTPTPQPLGFEVPFVIVGLLLVAYLIKRRKVK